MNNYFYVDIDDEITSVIGRLRKENSEEIFLVVPKRALIAQSLVNLKLLSKEANKLRKKLIFVSPDALTRKIAEKAGLSVKKYIAKPKEKEEPETGRQKKVSMQPWEEAAAKEELKNAIKKNPARPASLPVGKVGGEPEKSTPNKEHNQKIGATLNRAVPGATGMADFTAGALSKTRPSVSPPVKIKAGVFTDPSRMVKKPISASAKPQVVDLKKIASDAHRGMEPKKEKKHVLVKAKKGNNVPMEEPELKELLQLPSFAEASEGRPNEEKREIADDNMGVPLANKPSKRVRLAKTNPFKIRKLVKENHIEDGVIAPAGIVKPSQSLSLPSSDLPGRSRETEVKELLASPIASVINVPARQEPVNISKENVLPEEFERETANLTLREKERLRDLWMEQKKVVRGKSFQESSSLDLKASSETEVRKEEIVSQESGIFQTTHRRVVGPGKVIDLRIASTPLANGPSQFEDRRQPKKRKEIILPLLNIRLFLFFILGISAVLLIIMGIILPEATVLVKPKKSADNVELKAWVSGEVSQIDSSQRMIPGKAVHFKVNEEKLFPVTTQKEIKGNSVGQVTVYNQAGQPLSLKQNALLTDSSGNKFYTAAPITVPALKQADSNSNENTNANTNDNSGSNTAGSATVEVKSEGTGKDYNLKEGSSLSIPGLNDGEYSGLITAEVKKEIKGGESKMVNVVSQEDLDKAKEELLNKAREGSLDGVKNNLEADAANNIKPADLVIEDSSFTADKSVGQEADSFNATVSVTFFTVSFIQKDLQDLAKNVIESDRDNKNGSVEVKSFQLSDAKPLENKMEISTNLDYQIISQINSAEVKKALVAKKRQEAEDYLKGRNDVDQYTLDIWPSFLGHMPILERRVKVEIQ